MPTSPLPSVEPAPVEWPAFPTETEIYILPDGRIVIADLPAELAQALPTLGEIAPCDLPSFDASTPHER